MQFMIFGIFIILGLNLDLLLGVQLNNRNLMLDVRSNKYGKKLELNILSMSF